MKTATILIGGSAGLAVLCAALAACGWGAEWWLMAAAFLVVAAWFEFLRIK